MTRPRKTHESPAQQRDYPADALDTPAYIQEISAGLSHLGLGNVPRLIFERVAVLDSGPDGCYATVSQLAADTGVSEDDTMAALLNLQAHKVLYRSRRGKRGLKVTHARERDPDSPSWRPRIGARVALPGRVLDAPVPDQVIRVLGRIAELDLGPAGCYAKVTTLAADLGITVQSVHTGIRILLLARIIYRADHPKNGLKVTPFAFTAERGGYALVAPAGATSMTSARHYRAWAVVWRDHALGRETTSKSLASSLINTGSSDENPKPPRPVSAWTATQVLDDLEAGGWLVRIFRSGKTTLIEPQMWGEPIVRGALVEARKARRAARKPGPAAPELPAEQIELLGALVDEMNAVAASEEIEQPEEGQLSLFALGQADPARQIAGKRAALASARARRNPAERSQTGQQEDLGVIHNPPQPEKASQAEDPSDPPQPVEANPPQPDAQTPHNQTPYKREGFNKVGMEDLDDAPVVTDLHLVSEEKQFFADENDQAETEASPVRPAPSTAPAFRRGRGSVKGRGAELPGRIAAIEEEVRRARRAAEG